MPLTVALGMRLDEVAPLYRDVLVAPPTADVRLGIAPSRRDRVVPR